MVIKTGKQAPLKIIINHCQFVKKIIIQRNRNKYLFCCNGYVTFAE